MILAAAGGHKNVVDVLLSNTDTELDVRNEVRLWSNQLNDQSGYSSNFRFAYSHINFVGWIYSSRSGFIGGTQKRRQNVDT